MHSSIKRILVAISPYSLHLAIVSGRRLVACGDYSIDEKEAMAAFIATHDIKDLSLALVSLRQPFARLSGAEAGRVRSEAELLACAQTLPASPTSPLSAVACDAATGQPVDPAGNEPWLLAGTTLEGLAGAKDQLTALGLPTAERTGLALPAQLGAVVAALQDMPDSTRVAVLALGENDSVLALVSAGGVEAVRPVAFGYARIFEAVQVELGLKFRAAAPKLFFNAAYDFADAADKIAARLAPTIQAAIAEFSDAPALLEIVGLPAKQEWFVRALAQAVTLDGWDPDVAKVCAQLGMEIAEGITPTANALSLIQLAAANDAAQPAWLPSFLSDRPKPAPLVAPAASIAPTPVAPPPQAASVTQPPASAPVKPKPAAPRAAAPAPAKGSVVKPPAASVAHPVRPAPVAAKPAPVPVAASPKRPWLMYAVMAAVVLVASVVSVKFFLDSQQQAEELAARQAEDSARQEAERVRQLAVASAQAALKINPVTGLPGSWVCSDVGNDSSRGSAVFKQGEFTLTGSGRVLEATQDSFLFTYVPMSGDGVVTTRVVRTTDTGGASKFGLMIRGTMNDNAPHVSLLLANKAQDLKVVWRAQAGGNTSQVNASGDDVSIGVPIWLRLVRAGNTITAYHSENGRAWRLVTGAPLTVELPATVYVGMMVCAPDAQSSLTAFDHVSVPGWESAPPILAGDQ